MKEESNHDLEPLLQSEKEPRHRMKEEQRRMISFQYNDLISSLERAEEELETLKRERRFLDEENRALKESNNNLQVRAMSAEGQLDEAKSEYDVVESQLKTMTTKNKELFSLYEQEEVKSAMMTSNLEACKHELQCIGEKYNALVHASEATEVTTSNAIRESQLKTDEICLLRTEMDQLKQQNSKLRLKLTVELEALEEQLRLRKEKQYQLLGKLQSQEDACGQSEDRMKEAEHEIQNLRIKSSELHTALQLEASARLSQDNNNRSMAIDFQETSTENKELRSKLQEAEHARLKLEAEARDNGDQLREMAEKVFQLLERLKLAELGKKKSTEALGKREHELLTLKKQYMKVVEDNVNQKKINEQTDTKRLLVEDQLRGLQKVNSQLGQKLKDETKCRIREEEACNEAKEKVHVLDGRLAFLLNKLQTDEEARSVQQEDSKKMESQLQVATQRCETLQTKLTETEDRLRDATDKLQRTEQLVNDIQIKNQSMEQTLKDHEENVLRGERKSIQSKERSNKMYSDGHVRFFVDSNSMGHVAIIGKCSKDKVWIDETRCNSFLRVISKSQNAQELLIKRLAEMYGSLLCGEERLEKVSADLKAREEDAERIHHELIGIQGDVLKEEDSKRRILLRYIRAVKASASLGESGCEEDRNEVGGVGAGRINLPDVSFLCYIDKQYLFG